MIEDLPRYLLDLLRQQRLCEGSWMDAIVLHQCGIAGRDTLEEPGQIMNGEFIGDTFEDLLKALVISDAEVGRHAYSDQ